MLIIEPSNSAISGGHVADVDARRRVERVGIAAHLHHVVVAGERPEARALREVAPRAAARARRGTRPALRRAAWRRCLRGRAASTARCRRAGCRRRRGRWSGSGSPSWPRRLRVADVRHERRHALVGAWRTARRPRRRSMSIVHGLSSVASVTGRQPRSSCTWPPMTFTTWPVTPADRSDASQPTTAEMFSGAKRSNSPSFGFMKSPRDLLGEARARDRCDRVDAHADALELARHHDRHRRDAGLGRRVVGLARVAVEARLRRGVHDLARSPARRSPSTSPASTRPRSATARSGP